MSTDSTLKKVEHCLKSTPYTTFWSPTVSLFIIKYDEHWSDFLTTGVCQHCIGILYLGETGQINDKIGEEQFTWVSLSVRF